MKLPLGLRSILGALLLAVLPQAAVAQLYILNPETSTVAKYDQDTGALINDHFITGLTQPKNLVVANGAIYVVQIGASMFNGGLVGKYDAATGAAINANFVTGLSIPQFIAVSGHDLLVGSFDGSGQYAVIGKYNGDTGAVINRFFISIHASMEGLAATPDRIYVGSMGRGVASYDPATGQAINERLCPFSSGGMVAQGDAVWLSASVRYVGGATGGNTFKIDGNSGQNAMGLMHPLVRGVGGAIAVSGDELFIYNAPHGELRKYNASTGDEINIKFITFPPGTPGALAVVPRDAPAGSSLADATRNTFSLNHLDYLMALFYSFPALGFGLLAALVIVPIVAAFVIRRLLRRPAAPVEIEPLTPAEPVEPEPEPEPAAPPPPPAPVVKAAPVSWKVVLLLMGCVFGLLFGTVALIYEVVLPMYIRQIAETHEAAYDHAADVAAAKAPPLPPPTLPHAGPPPKTLPAVLTDPYGSEDNWIVAMIANRMTELAGMSQHAFVTVGGGFEIKADVQLDPTKVHVEIGAWKAKPVPADLQPEFAWDAKGYAPLVATLLGSVPPTETLTEPAPDEVTTLLNPTTPILAREDVTVTNFMAKHFEAPEAHEDAALLLVAFALRDRAGGYTDARPALSLATAHLAWAQALRASGTSTPSWAGALADVGIRAIAGRETDALEKILALISRPDCSAADKAWLDTFRLRATDNWTLLDNPSASTPLVELIAWSQALNDNLDAAGADRRLQKVGTLPPVSDFGHASITNLVQHSVQTDNQYCESTTQQDVADLAQALQIEGATPPADATVGQVLSKPLDLYLLAAGMNAIRVAGPDLFKDFARRHLLYELWMTRVWLKDELGAGDDSEQQFRTAALKQFGGMRRLENTFLFGDDLNRFNVPEILGEAKKNNQTWFPWELADGNLVSTNSNVTDYHPDIDTLHNFYRDGLPFGTVYNVENREHTLYTATQFHKNEQRPADGRQEFNTYPWGSTMEALNPDSYTAFHLRYGDGNADPDAFTKNKRWWDYNLPAIHEAEKNSDGIAEDQYVDLLQKHAALEPAAWFILGQHLRNEGKDDDAAVADRKGFEQDDDAVGMSNSVGALVDYYLDNGKMSDAETVGKGAADTGSECGLLIYSQVLEKEGHVKEALETAKAASDRYNGESEWRVTELYAAHPDVFPDENKALLQKDFPSGLQKVTISSFSGPPQVGCAITSNSPQLQRASLNLGDVIVGLDGYKIESEPQYDYVRALTTDPKMDFIVWRQTSYLEVHVTQPHRKFHVDLDTYKP